MNLNNIIINENFLRKININNFSFKVLHDAMDQKSIHKLRKYKKNNQLININNKISTFLKKEKIDKNFALTITQNLFHVYYSTMEIFFFIKSYNFKTINIFYNEQVNYIEKNIICMTHLMNSLFIEKKINFFYTDDHKSTKIKSIDNFFKSFCKNQLTVNLPKKKFKGNKLVVTDAQKAKGFNFLGNSITIGEGEFNNLSSKLLILKENKELFKKNFEYLKKNKNFNYLNFNNFFKFYLNNFYLKNTFDNFKNIENLLKKKTNFNLIKKIYVPDCTSGINQAIVYSAIKNKKKIILTPHSTTPTNTVHYDLIYKSYVINNKSDSINYLVNKNFAKKIKIKERLLPKILLNKKYQVLTDFLKFSKIFTINSFYNYLSNKIKYYQNFLKLILFKKKKKDLFVILNSDINYFLCNSSLEYKIKIIKKIIKKNERNYNIIIRFKPGNNNVSLYKQYLKDEKIFFSEFENFKKLIKKNSKIIFLEETSLMTEINNKNQKYLISNLNFYTNNNNYINLKKYKIVKLSI